MSREKAVAALGCAVAGVALLALPKTVNAPSYRSEMAAVKAISVIHTAQTQYYAEYGVYASTLRELGPERANLIDPNLAGGEKGGFKFVLQQQTPTGYGLIAAPIAPGTKGSHTYYSDQSMTIHQHKGQEPATVNDPLLGETTLQQQRQTR